MAVKVKKMEDDEQAQNELNIKIKGQPWYTQFLQSIGQDPNRVKLSGDERKALQSIAARNGVQLPQGVQFDPAGNVNEKHGFAGQPGWVKAIEIGAALAPVAYLAAPALAGLGGPGALGAGEASTTLGATGGLVPGLSTAASTGLGTTGLIASGVKPGLSTIDRVGSLLRDSSKAVGDMTTAAGNNRLNENDARMTADTTNIINKGRQETNDAAREAIDRKNLYKASVARNPQVSPYNAKGVPALSPELMAGLSEMEKASLARLQAGRDPFTPYEPKGPSTLERIGNYASPAMSTIGMLSKYL